MELIALLLLLYFFPTFCLYVFLGCIAIFIIYWINLACESVFGE